MSKFLYVVLIIFLSCWSCDLFAQPANDNCSNPTSFGTLPAPAACTGTGIKRGTTVTLTGQTNVGATPDPTYVQQSCAFTVANYPNDVWYSFVASSYQATISVSNATFANPYISVWQNGACANQGGMGCIIGSANAASITIYQLVIGQTYYFQVAGNSPTQNGTFNVSVHNDDDCANCLVSSTLVATPPPVNGTYAPGQTVTFCFTVTSWDETNTNWLHGMQPSFGAGWNLATLTPGTPPASIDGLGTWGWYPTGVTSSATGTPWPTGFYYNSTDPNNLAGGPGNSFGDNCDDLAGQSCIWQFCVTITTKAVCSPGSNLSATFNTSGDGESGVWSSVACSSDQPAIQYAVGSCCPPNMTSTPATCANTHGGTATATPVGTYSPWTFHWSNGVTQTGLTGPSTITGLAVGIDTVTVTDALNCTSTAFVNVTGPAVVNAGPSQIVTCAALPGGTATMAATGTGTWTQQSGPGTSTITTPTSTSTTITNYSAAGIYVFAWTNGSGCADTATVTVTAKPNAGANQTVNCAVLPGGTATMAAVGAGTWTAQAGNPGTATITTPTSPTTTITTFSAAGTYTFVWTNASGCTNTATVTVTAKPNAGANQTVNCAVLPGGTATMTAVGAGTWTAQAGNPGTATITTPASPTTTVTTFSAAGIYTFVWTNASGCTNTATVTVTAQPTAGPNQTVTCAVLPGGTATMAAVGAGTWTAQAGNPGTATITTPASPTTTITTFSAVGVYTFVWTNASGCTNTATVTVTAKPNAGPNQTVNCAVLPGGTATMAAVGAGTWTAQAGNPGTATITTPASPTTTITTFSVAGVYTFVWTNASGCTNTATVTVTAKPNAGPDQTVTCAVLPGGTATMAAVGAGTWSAMAGNTGTATITTPASPTTTITTYSASGAYSFIWTNASGCTDTAKVVVTAKPSAGPDQTVVCAVLPGGSATMGGAGAGTWTAMAGNPGTATITTPTSPTTTITNYSAAGTYSFIWTNASGCADTAAIVVTAKPNAGPDRTVTCVMLPGGTATMAGTGAGTWTAMAGNPGTATITTPTSPTTTITTYSAAGMYKFIWANASGCTDTANVVVTAKPNAGVDQTVTCYPINTTATMSGIGAGAWTAMAGNPGTAVITTPTSPTTTITTFSTSGTFNFIWTNASGCTDTAAIFVTTKPNAGPDQTVTCAVLPGGNTTMAATGIGTWSAMAGNPGTATITTPTSPTSSITTFSAAGTFYFLWTNGACADTAAVVVTAKPNAGPDQTVTCAVLPGGSATMAAIGAGTWTAQAGNPGTATITTPASPTSTITTFSVIGTYKFIWTNASGCTDTANVVVTAKPNAGIDQTVVCVVLPVGSATMAGTGAGTWTVMAGNPGTATITTPTSPTTTVTTFSVAGTYNVIWTNASGCTDTAAIVVTAKPNAGTDQTVSCIDFPGGSATMAATGVGTWTAMFGNPCTTTITTPTSPTSTITAFSAAGTYKFIWTNASGCTDTANVLVTAKPNAGPDQVVTCYPIISTATMAATGVGTWSPQPGNPGTATISTPTNPTTTITTFSVAGIYNFIWANANGCTDTAAIDVTTKPNAGPDQIVTCAILPGGTATMAAAGNGTWSPMVTNPGTATITTPASPTTTITNFSAAGTYSFIWTISTCTDTANITVTAKPNAGPDQTVNCAILPGGIATMAAIGAGTWTTMTGNPGSATITTPTNPITTITTFSAAGTYNFIWTNASGCPDTVAVVVTAKPNAGPDQIVNCAIIPGGSATMAATGAGTWTADPGNLGTATISATTSPTTTINTFSAAGTYNFIWTNASGCADTAVITVTAKPNAGPDQTVTCAIMPGGSATMAAVGIGTWTTQLGNPGTSTITTPSNATTTITSFSIAGTYNFIWTNVNGCTDTASVIVTSKPDAGPDQTVSCTIIPGGSATMAGTGTGTWSAMFGNPGNATITTSTSPLTTITNFSAPGTYSFIWTNASGCTDTASIVVTQEPTITLSNASYCLGGNATLIPNASPAGGTYAWSNAAVTASITVNPVVTTYYTVVYTLGSCSATATDTVTVNPLPVVTVSTFASVCTAGNGMAIANVSAGTPGYSYSWSAPGGSRDSLTNLAPGNYQVVVTDINHCTATASGTVALQSPAIIINEVSQHDLKCFNDGTGDIYISMTDTAGNAGVYNYTYSWGGGISSQNLTNVQAGTYTVVVTDQFGCTGTASYTLIQPLALTGSTSQVNPHCFGDANGTATVTPTGGSGAYHYAWNTTPVQNSQQATGLIAGAYTVSVTDDSLCQATFNVTLVDPAAITFGASIIVDPSCFGSSNGTAQVTPQNGVGSYTYLWSINAQTSDPAIGLPQGTYTVTATDDNGCTGSTTVTLTQPSQVAVTVTPSNLTCFGSNNGSATAVASGGTPPYTYLWNNSDSTATITGLPASTYTVKATDANGCTISGSTTLSQPTAVSESLWSVRTNCPDSKDGTVTALAAGGTGTYSYTLEDATGNILQTGNTSGIFTGVGYGLYIVVATDQNSCPISDTITVQRAPFNFYTDTAISTSCYGSQYHDGAIHLQGYSIPNGPFQYSIDNGPLQISPDFYNLSAGPHTVMAQDNYGCDTTFTVVVAEPLPAVLQILPGDSTIVPGTTLQLSNNFGPYSIDSIKGYSWSPGTGMSCIDCPSPMVSPYADQTVYTLVVTYNQGCIATASVQINTNGVPPVYIPNAFTPNGDGVNDVWYVYGTGIKDIKAMIFNRWGEKVFESDDQSLGWDGTFKGELQPPGVYVYIVDMVYLNAEKRSKQGSVTLIR